MKNNLKSLKTDKLNISSGGTRRSNAIFTATTKTITANSALISSPLSLFAANTPNCAPITEEIIKKKARIASTAKVVVVCNRVMIAVIKMIWNNLI